MISDSVSSEEPIFDHPESLPAAAKNLCHHIHVCPEQWRFVYQPTVQFGRGLTPWYFASVSSSRHVNDSSDFTSTFHTAAGYFELNA